MGELTLSKDEQISFLHYTGGSRDICVMICCYTHMPGFYEVDSYNLGFSTGVQSGSFDEALRIARDLIVRVSQDPLAVIMFDVEQKIKEAIRLTDYSLDRSRMRINRKHELMRETNGLSQWLLNNVPAREILTMPKY